MARPLNKKAKPSHFNPQLSRLTKTAGSLFHEEDWMGGDFFVKIGDRFIVKQNIAIYYDNDTHVIHSGDKILVKDEEGDKYVIIINKKDKYKIKKQDFYSISGKLANK